MTGKRFECYDLIFLDGFIKDTLTKENIVGPIKLIHLLNELHEENQQLKELRHEDINELAVIIQECYMDFPEETGHLKKSTPQSQIDSIIKDRWINKKIEELRKLGYSDEYINKKLGHLVNWRI